MLGFSPLAGRPLSGTVSGADFIASLALVLPYDIISIHAFLGSSPGLMSLFENGIPVENVCNGGCGESAYNYGELLRLRTVITTLDKILADPESLTLYIKLPNGTIETHSTGITKNNTGNYQFDYFIPVGGTYSYRWVSAGGIDAVAESSFSVNFSPTLS